MPINEEHPAGAVVRREVAGAVAGRVGVRGGASSAGDVTHPVVHTRSGHAKTATGRGTGIQHKDHTVAARRTRSVDAGRAPREVEDRRLEPGAAVNMSAADDSPQVKESQMPGGTARLRFAHASNNARRNNGAPELAAHRRMGKIDGHEHPIAPARYIEDAARHAAGSVPARSTRT